MVTRVHVIDRQIYKEFIIFNFEDGSIGKAQLIALCILDQREEIWLTDLQITPEQTPQRIRIQVLLVNSFNHLNRIGIASLCTYLFKQARIIVQGYLEFSMHSSVASGRLGPREDGVGH